MITLRSTREGLEITRYLPFIIFGNEEGGRKSSSVSPCPLILTKLEEKNYGKDR